MILAERGASVQLHTWNRFNIFQVERLTQGRPLYTVTLAIMDALGLLVISQRLSGLCFIGASWRQVDHVHVYIVTISCPVVSMDELEPQKLINTICTGKSPSLGQNVTSQ